MCIRDRYYDYVFDGIWQKDDDIANSHMPTATPGSIKLRDVNNDNQITADDRVVMQRDPKWIGTVGTSFNYKGFDLSADLYISHEMCIRDRPFTQHMQKQDILNSTLLY